MRNGFAYSADLPISNLLPNGPRYTRPDLGDGGFMRYVKRQFDPSLSLRDLEWLVGRTRLPVLVDGGIRRMLTLLRHEFDVAMALVGCRSLAEVDRSLVARIGERPREAMTVGGVR